MANEKAEFAVKILKQYAEETGNLPRGTSDISPLEEWLILQMFTRTHRKVSIFGEIKKGEWYAYNEANDSKNPSYKLFKCNKIEIIEGVGTFYDGHHHIWCELIIFANFWK